MRKALKWAGITVGGIVVIAVLVLAGLYISAGNRLSKTYSIQPAAVSLPTSPAAIERGRKWARTHCAGCHGENLGGTPFFEDPALGRIPASNLTSGKGGVAAAYGDADWVRAIRHGVKRDGKPILIMPAEAFYWFSDDDLGTIIAYLKTVPPIDNDLGGYSVTPLAHVLLAAGALGNSLTAEIIDHGGPRLPAPSPAVTAAYGEYLMKTGGCQGCHSASLAGAQPSEPGAPFAPNLTPGGNLGKWTEADFLTALRTQKSRFMPFEGIGRMSDDELKALWLYLQSLPARESAKR